MTNKEFDELDKILYKEFNKNFKITPNVNQTY